MSDRARLCELLPHAGSMCLLDTLVHWDADRIVCETHSHHDPENPLRSGDRLHSINAIEYAAQAMGIHGGLKARQEGRQVTAGFLGALRDVTLCETDLAACRGPLRIEANRLMAQPGGSIYTFTVTCDDMPIVSGRATMILQTTAE